MSILHQLLREFESSPSQVYKYSFHARVRRCVIDAIRQKFHSIYKLCVGEKVGGVGECVLYS